jgi:uncharacterized protein YlzI (FlbEa/FlbD family)
MHFMIPLILLSAIGLIELHGPHGQIIYVNPAEITSIREPRSLHLHRFVPGTQCVITVTNGSLIAVNESCAEVRNRAEGRAPSD